MEHQVLMEEAIKHANEGEERRKIDPIFLSPQNQCLIDLLTAGRYTTLEIIKTGQTTSPHTRFTEIRRAGYEIKSDWMTTATGKRCKVYWIEQKGGTQCG